MAQSQTPNGSVLPVGSGAAGAQFGTTSLYAGDLDASVTDSQLFDAFSQMGQVVSVRVCRDLATRRSLGYGYVNFTTPQDAARAIQELNYIPLNGKPVRVMHSHRDPSVRRSGAGNIFIKNLDKSIDHKALHDTFSAFGNIISCKVALDSSGQSKGYGFVQYETEESAQRATAELNGMLLNDKQVYVGPFLRRQERDSNTAANVTKFTNLYVKNLAESTTDEDLKSAFGEFGEITSAVVMRDGDGKSKGFGFVNFEDAGDAAKAVEGLNGKTFGDKEWYVGRAQKKSERESELKVRYEESLREAADKFQSCNLYVKNLDESISDEKLKEMFAPCGTVTSSKPGFGYQQQLVPGMRPGGAPPMQNFFMPMVQQGQQRPGGRRPVGIQPQQHQMQPRGRMFRYPQGRGSGDVPGRLPYEMPQHVPIGALATSLANASPEHQRTMLGENLYPLVEQLEAESAAKVTGMLLEMDQTEVLHLLESPEALKAKVAEAMDVLRNVAAGGAAEQLSSLNLN
ncbi:hypothetical protein F2Q70_00010522 [Brassica cretica]|uniref:PABP n=1 Tax=Brassica cretica TaxID=69181 RepID=A0A8S9LXB3_BRACR|nr:hypothetical protein F2Q70_00010522 [Brassica cretica]